MMNLLHNHIGNPLTIKKINHLAVDEYLTCACLQAMLQEKHSKVIYMEREFASVLQSMYYYTQVIPKNQYNVKQSTTLQQFLQNDDMILDIASMWTHTVQTWRNLADAYPDQVLVLRFEDVHAATSSDIDRIANFLHRTRKSVPDSRKDGVGVGLGKGMGEIPLPISDKARWALDAVKNSPLRFWNNVKTYAKPLNVPSCLPEQANFERCPAVWKQGEIVKTKS